jgi:hypothetical protein
MRRLRVYSATQVDTFLLCRRKWAFDKVEGIKGPPNQAAQEGLAVHEQLDAWLGRGVPLNTLTAAGKVAMAGLHLLPAPMTPGLESETQSYVDLSGWKFVVKKDWQRLDIMPPIVGDHKTTKDFRWMKNAADLRTDVQACLYAAETMLSTGSPVVDLQWTYFRTRGAPKAEPVRVRVTAEEIAPTVEKIVATAAEMQLVHDLGLRALDLPPSAESCDAYGGCFFQSHCNLTPQERLKSIMSQAQRSNDFLAMMQQRQAGQVNPPPVQGPPPGAQYAQQPPAGPPAGAQPPVPYQDAQGNWVLPPQGTPPAAQQPPAQATQGPPAGAAPARRGPGRPRKNPEVLAAAAPQGAPAQAPQQPPAQPEFMQDPASGQWFQRVWDAAQNAWAWVPAPVAPAGAPAAQLGAAPSPPPGPFVGMEEPHGDPARADLIAQLQTLTRQLQNVAQTVQAIADGQVKF